MGENLKIALMRVLFALSILTIGMMVSTAFEYGGFDAISYNIFSISWSLSLFTIILSLTKISKPIDSLHKSFLLFLLLSFMNLCDSVCFASSGTSLREWFLGIGVIIYFSVIINKSIIERK